MPFYPTVEEGVLRHIFQRAPYTPAFPFYLGLLDASWVELIGQPGYARVGPINPWDFDWPTAEGIIANSVVFNFPVATGNWTKGVKMFALFDSNGQVFLNHPLDDIYTVFKGQMLTFVVGALKTKMADFAMSVEYEGVLPGVTGHNAFSNYLKDRLLRHLFGKEPYSPPHTWAGLLTCDPGDGLTNTDCCEVSGVGTSYGRAYVDPMDWEVLITEAWNYAEIKFPTATSDWGVVRHFALFDVSSPSVGGHALLHGPMEPKGIVNGSAPKFKITVPIPGQKGSYEELGIGFGVL